MYVYHVKRLKFPLDNYNIIWYGGYMEAKQDQSKFGIKVNQVIDYTLFETEPAEELLENEEYIHLRQLDQELQLGIFKYAV